MDERQRQIKRSVPKRELLLFLLIKTLYHVLLSKKRKKAARPFSTLALIYTFYQDVHRLQTRIVFDDDKVIFDSVLFPLSLCDPLQSFFCLSFRIPILLHHRHTSVSSSSSLSVIFSLLPSQHTQYSRTKYPQPISSQEVKKETAIVGTTTTLQHQESLNEW